MGTTRESLTYLVWGTNIVRKTKLMVRGEQEDPKAPPIQSPYSSLRIRALFSAGATGERAQRSLFGLPWALLWIPPKVMFES